MKNLKISIISTVFILFLIACSTSTQTDYKVLKGATIFDGNGNSIQSGVIVIHDGIIVTVGTKNTEIPDGSTIKDLTGQYIIPGLVDAHMHFFQTGFFDSRPDALDLRDSLDYEKVQMEQKNNPNRYYESYLRSGVTAVYDLGGFSWSIGLQESAENNLSAPHVAASGILLSPVPKEKTQTFNTQNDSVYVNYNSPEYVVRITHQNDSLGATGIKIHQLYLNDSLFMKSMLAVKREVARLGNKLIIHAQTLEQAKEALRLDAKILAHSVNDQLIDEEFIQLAKKTGVIYCPTLMVKKLKYNAYKSVLDNDFPIDDQNNAVDNGTKLLLQSAGKFLKFIPKEKITRVWLNNYLKYTDEIFEINAKNIRLIHDAGIRIAVGTDAGNPGILHGVSINAEMEAIQRAGITPIDIITMATKNGAIAMDRLDDFGTLESNKIADLIVLDKDPSQDISNIRSISHVMRGGLLRTVKEPFENTANKTYE